MRAISRWSGAALLVVTVAGSSLIAQPSQFKANVRMKDAADGSTATGVIYVGSAKTRTELSKDGQELVILADPAAHTQVVIMPSEKMYMQMPTGQGPVSVPATGPTDPTNPCAGGSGNTDCVKGPNETINGHPTVRWDFTTREGVRTRAWVSPKLRFPIKTTDDNGGSLEFSDIAEGPQPASLFAIPAGYNKMDVGAMGGMGMASGRGNTGRAGARGNPMGDMMANLPPEAQAAMAAAMSGRGAGATPPGASGSAWEKTKGWVLGVTITGTASKSTVAPKGAANEGTEEQATYSTKYVASIPLNYGTPGVPGFSPQGPAWHHMAGVGGSPEILAKPLTISVEAESKTDTKFRGNCPIAEDPYTSVATMKNSAQQSASMSQPAGPVRTQAVFKLSPDLKTYDLTVGFGLPAQERINKKIDFKACRTGQPYTKNETSTRQAEYSAAIELKGLTLPASVSAITGTKKMPLTLDGRQLDATVNWTLTPIP